MIEKLLEKKIKGTKNYRETFRAFKLLDLPWWLQG